MVDPEKERIRGIRVATALAGGELNDTVLEDIQVFVHAGTAPPLDLPLVTNLNALTRARIDSDPPRAYLLARFGILAAARIPAKSYDDHVHRDFALAEAYRQHLAACIGMRFIIEARDSAAKAHAFYRKPDVEPLVTFQPVLVGLNEAWIAFYSDDIDAAVAVMKKCTETLRDRFHDALRYTITRNHYGSMLIQVGRHQEALEVLVDLLEYIDAGSNPDPALRGSVFHNSATARQALGLPCPQDWLAIARDLQNDFLAGQSPRNKYHLAEQLKFEGKRAEAVSVLYMIRSEFEALDQEVVAAATVRAIVEELVPLGRISEAEFIGWPAVEILERYGMLLESRRIRRLLAGPDASPKKRARARKPAPHLGTRDLCRL